MCGTTHARRICKRANQECQIDCIRKLALLPWRQKSGPCRRKVAAAAIPRTAETCEKRGSTPFASPPQEHTTYCVGLVCYTARLIRRIGRSDALPSEQSPPRKDGSRCEPPRGMSRAVFSPLQGESANRTHNKPGTLNTFPQSSRLGTEYNSPL